MATIAASSGRSRRNRNTVGQTSADILNRVSAVLEYKRHRVMIGQSIQKRVGMLILATVVIAATALTFSRPPIPQPARYHDFADQRTFFGVPNFMDVVSNVAFLFVGIWGLSVVFGRESSSDSLTRAERWPYGVFFLGVALTFVGSSYYHLHPIQHKTGMGSPADDPGIHGNRGGNGRREDQRQGRCAIAGAAGHCRRAERPILALDGSSRAR